MNPDGRSGIERQQVFTSLFEELSHLRPGVHQDRMAQLLLRSETEYKHLVGIVDEGERAIFYDARTEELIAVPFDHHETRDSEATVLWSGLRSDRSWEEALDLEFDWLHPHHR